MNEEDKRIKPNVLNKANKEIAILNQEKKNQVKELAVAYKEIAFQIEERGKRATELAIANIELVFQNEEKEKRLTELRLANVELQQAEADIRKLNANLEHQVIKRTAQYAFISQINQTIVHVKNAETLFRKSCSVAIEFGKFKMAWIGRFDVAQKITLLDFSGIAKQDIKLFTDAAYVSNSPQDYVLRTGKYFHCKDIKHAFELESWKSYAVKHDISSCIIVPIVKSGSIYGTFNLYAGEANFFDDEIIKLAIEATGDISFALDLFEKAEKQVESEKQIIKNEKRFRALIENSSDMITLTSKEGIVLYGSPSITKLFGYSPDDIINTATIDYIHPEDKASFT
jgi:PAS domain-containing protein